MLKSTLLAATAIAMFSGVAHAEISVSDHLRSLAKQVEAGKATSAATVSNLEARLAQVKRDHIASVNSLTVSVAKLTGESVAASDNSVAALAAAESQNVAALTEAKIKAATILANVENTASAALAAAESQGLTALNKARVVAAVAIATAKAEGVAAVNATRVAGEVAIAAVKAASVKALTASEDNRVAAVAAADTKRTEAIAALRDKQTRELTALRGSSSSVLSALRDQHAAETADLKGQFATTVSTLEDNRIETIASLEIKRLDAISKLNASIAKLRAGHVKEVALLEIKRVEGIDALREVFKEKKRMELAEANTVLDSTYRHMVRNLETSVTEAQESQATAEDKFPRFIAATVAHTNYRVELDKGTAMVAACADSIGFNPFNKLAKFENVSDCAKVLAHIPKLNEVTATYSKTNVAEFEDNLDLDMIKRMRSSYVSAVKEARGSQVNQNSMGNLLDSILGGNK